MKTEQNKTAYLDLFSGIGGFALGAYWAGLRFDYHYFSEIDDYAIKGVNNFDGGLQKQA